MMGHWKPAYLHRIGAAQSMTEKLQEAFDGFDQFLDALPPEPRSYFEEFRSLVADALAMVETWWALPEPQEQ